MTFNNPDPTYGAQADRVAALYDKATDVRDKYRRGETDARHVHLNAVASAAAGAICVLRLLHWAKSEGGEAQFIAAIRLPTPELINMAAEDMLRMARLSLLVDSQFQIEALFTNITKATGAPPARNGFFVAARAALQAAGVSDQGQKLAILMVPAHIRNCLHSNGVHHAHPGANTALVVDGVDFNFEDGKRVVCASWFHIVTSLSASLEIVDEILASPAVSRLGVIPDDFTDQRAIAQAGP